MACSSVGGCCGGFRSDVIPLGGTELTCCCTELLSPGTEVFFLRDDEFFVSTRWLKEEELCEVTLLLASLW